MPLCCYSFGIRSLYRISSDIPADLPIVSTVAPLTLLSPGAVTDGVTLFFLTKSDDLFSHRRHFHPLRLPSGRYSAKFYTFNMVSPLYGVTRGNPPPPTSPP